MFVCNKFTKAIILFNNTCNSDNLIIESLPDVP